MYRLLLNHLYKLLHFIFQINILYKFLLIFTAYVFIILNGYTPLFYLVKLFVVINYYRKCNFKHFDTHFVSCTTNLSLLK